MKVWFTLLMVFFINVSFAENKIPIALEHVKINPNDIESLKRGAKFFASTCMSCHSLVYLRYNSFAKAQGITYEKMPVNSKVEYFGVKPPDLSLETRVRGPNWIYTYLNSFYVDPKRPSGFNNLVLENTAMPNFLAPFQGTQKLIAPFTSNMVFSTTHQWYDLLQLEKPGSMTQQQYDQTITDVVNFLAYAAEPYKVTQHYIGIGVIIFLLIFFIFAYLLKQNYWRDVKLDL